VVVLPPVVSKNICKMGVNVAYIFVFMQDLAGGISQGMFLSLMYIDITKHTCILKLNCPRDSSMRKM